VNFSAGARLEQSEILAPLGAGGMGIVNRARDAQLGREVAIKVLPADVARDPDRLARFDSRGAAARIRQSPEHRTIHGIVQSTIGPQVFWRMVAEGRGGEQRPKPIVTINKAWKSAVRAAGCPGRIPHDMRRTAVRNLVRAGISENVAMKMTGHKTRSVFERYNITSGSDLKDAARKMDAASGR
jgi:serine/threonine protein kinase